MKAATITIALALLILLTAVKAGATIPPKLAKQARHLAKHGGVLSTHHGDATPRMKELVRRLVVARFAPSGTAAVRTALCVVAGESGGNPGAISRTGDYGTGQINRVAHEAAHPSWWQPRNGFRYALLDPVFGVGVMWAMSRRGTSWSPWVVWQWGSCG